MTTFTTQNDITALPDLLWHSAARYGDLPALLVKREGAFETVTHALLAEDALALATALSACIPANAAVLLVGCGGYDLIQAYLALVMGANTPVLVDSTLSPTALARVAAAQNAVAVLYADEAAEAASTLSLPTAIPFSALHALTEEGRTAAENAGFSLREAAPDATATVFAAEKGEALALTHGEITSILTGAAQACDINEEDRVYATLPLFNAAALLLGVLLPLSRGASTVLGGGVSTILADMRLSKPTHAVTVSFIAEAILQKSRQTVSKKRQNTMAKPLAALRGFKERLLPSARHLFGGKLREMLIVGAPPSADAEGGLRQIGITSMQVDDLLCPPPADEESDVLTAAEALLCQSPLLSEAAVLSVPDGAGALESVAVLVLATPDADITLSEQQMEDWVCTVNKSLPEHEQISLFTLRTVPLPRDPDGNICRDLLAKELTGASV